MTTTLTETMAQYRNLLLNEKWDSKMHTAPKDKGKFKGKSKSEIGSGLAKNKKTAENDRKTGKKEPASLKKNIKQKEFALRAKNNFGKVSEGFLRESPHPKMEAILNKFANDVDSFIESGFDLNSTGQEFQYALYEYYVADMPYGTAKARTGDPDEWITEHFSKYLEDNGLLPEEAPIPVDDDFSNENLGPNWGRDGASNGRPLGENNISEAFPRHELSVTNYGDSDRIAKSLIKFGYDPGYVKEGLAFIVKHLGDKWYLESHKKLDRFYPYLKKFLTSIMSKYGNDYLDDAADDMLYHYNEEPSIGPYSQERLGEGKTNRKCKGKGCDKKCPDGKNYCSKKCEASKKAVKESKFTPGPFSKAAKLNEGKKKEGTCDTKGCKKLANHNGTGGNYCSPCFDKRTKKQK